MPACLHDMQLHLAASSTRLETAQRQHQCAERSKPCDVAQEEAFFKRYLEYCRVMCAPRLSQQAGEYLVNEYVGMRGKVGALLQAWQCCPVPGILAAAQHLMCLLGAFHCYSWQACCSHNWHQCSKARATRAQNMRDARLASMKAIRGPGAQLRLVCALLC